MPDLACGVLVAERYRLVEKVGTGGMGSVWLARDTTLDRECAVKVLEGKYVVHPDLLERFEHEAKATAAVRTPHVVEVFDYGVWNGLPFLVLEYLQGEDLARRMRRLGRLDTAATYRVLAHVARALARAHAQGIVHRDLKPANVLISGAEDGEIAKLIDFGVAEDARFDDGAAGLVIGTPAYMSPEQARGLRVDWRSDLWSLGVLAFECLTGRMLFDSASSTHVTDKILYGELPSPRELVPELPQALDGWFRRALAREPAERFQSAKELADAFACASGEVTPLPISQRPPRLADGSRSMQPSSRSDEPVLLRHAPAPPTRRERVRDHALAAREPEHSRTCATRVSALRETGKRRGRHVILLMTAILGLLLARCTPSESAHPVPERGTSVAP